MIEEIRLASASVRYLSEPYLSAAIKSYQIALQHVFMSCVVIALVALVSSAFIKELSMDSPTAPKPAQPDAERQPAPED